MIFSPAGYLGSFQAGVRRELPHWRLAGFCSDPPSSTWRRDDGLETGIPGSHLVDGVIRELMAVDAVTPRRRRDVAKRLLRETSSFFRNLYRRSSQ